MFGAGTACVVCPINRILYQGEVCYYALFRNADFWPVHPILHNYEHQLNNNCCFDISFLFISAFTPLLQLPSVLFPSIFFLNQLPPTFHSLIILLPFLPPFFSNPLFHSFPIPFPFFFPFYLLFQLSCIFSLLIFLSIFIFLPSFFFNPYSSFLPFIYLSSLFPILFILSFSFPSHSIPIFPFFFFSLSFIFPLSIPFSFLSLLGSFQTSD